MFRLHDAQLGQTSWNQWQGRCGHQPQIRGTQIFTLVLDVHCESFSAIAPDVIDKKSQISILAASVKAYVAFERLIETGEIFVRTEHLKYLACPQCKQTLVILEVEKRNSQSVEAGTLQCSSCRQKYGIVRHIPRFVALENYASGFGLQWAIHARTQYDSYSGANISETRFFNETRWPKDLKGQVILEVGSGSGRFTEQAASTGAMVVSMDYSQAVEANYASNGDRDNVLIVQGDIYNMPFRENYFDKVLCIGVLQHTPKVEESFMQLPQYLKPGGEMVIDVYRKFAGLLGLLRTRYWVRPITRRIPAERLYALVKRYVESMWPISGWISKIPRIGRNLNLALLIADYRGVYTLSDEMLREWAILDTFDKLSPAYDYPQTLETVKTWFLQTDLINVQVQYGYNGIEGRGTKAFGFFSELNRK